MISARSIHQRRAIFAASVRLQFSAFLLLLTLSLQAFAVNLPVAAPATRRDVREKSRTY